ncbi:MAG: putative S-layer protein [Nanoarchaeota archaeon]
MKTQKLFAVLFSALLLSLALVSAANFYQPTTSVTESVINGTALATSITLEGTSSITPTTSVSNLILTTSIPASTYTGLFLGKAYTGSINVSNSSTSQIVPVQIVKTFCSNGSSTNTTRYLEITSVKDTSSDDDWEWKPADTVTIAVKVKFENTADSDDSIDAVVKLSLYDSVDNTFVDMDNEDDLEKDISLDEGSSTTEDFTIEVPISELEDSSDRYKLYVKVYEDGTENSVCKDNWNSQYNQNVQIQKNSYDVILKDLEINSASVPCGQEVTITGTAINVGSNDEDKVYVKATNVLLGVNLTTSTFALDEGDSNKVSFSFLIPTNAAEKAYTVYLETHFKYSDSSDTFREESDAYEVDLIVEGCVPPVTATVTAGFSAETPKAVIGNQVIIEATIKNTGTATAAYTIDVTGNTAWSTLAEIDPKTFTLNAGEEKKVNVYLNINSNAAEGDQTFTIKTTSGTYTTEKTVQLALEKGLTSQAIMNNLKQYWYIYLIALIILVLVIAIIVAIVSLSKKN